MRADSDPPAGRILVVDDHALFRQSLQRLLEYSGFEVTTAENGLRGLLATTQSEFDLILLDVNMPGLDGFDVCAAIKASPQCAATPVVFVSASDDANAIGTAREVGASWQSARRSRRGARTRRAPSGRAGAPPARALPRRSPAPKRARQESAPSGERGAIDRVCHFRLRLVAGRWARSRPSSSAIVGSARARASPARNECNGPASSCTPAKVRSSLPGRRAWPLLARGIRAKRMLVALSRTGNRHTSPQRRRMQRG